MALFGRDRERAWCTHAFSHRRLLAICGLAGIGKTSLLRSAAHEQARRVAGTVVYHVCADGDRIGSVLASLLAGDSPGPPRSPPLRAALDELTAWALRTPLVLCIDDAHRIADPLLLEVLAHLGTVSAPLWLVVASRRELPLPASEIDGAMLRLGPLSVASARALWDDLEDRFGPALVRFDTLGPARCGSPFALRRAYATGLAGDEDGVDLTGLADREAALLAQICAFDGPVEVERLAAIIPEPIAALPGLLRALLVDLTPARSIVVHDLVRAAVARSARPVTAAEHLICLTLYEASNDDLARLRHMVGAQRWAAAAELVDKIVRPQSGFIPLGVATETQVLAAFTALEHARVALPLPLRLARLQLAARHGQGRAVLEALREEATREPAAWAHLGTVELLLGDALAAETHIRRALAEPSIAGGPIVRAFLLGLLLEILRTQGRVDPQCEVLREFQQLAAAMGPVGASVAQVMVAAISYDREDFEDAAARLRSAQPYISLLALVPALQAMHALLERATGAALASPAAAAAPAVLTRALFEDVDFLRVTLLLFAADGDVFEGNLDDAEARARDAEAIATRGGYRGLRQWAIYVRAECLRMRGCAAAAVELAELALADPLIAVHRRQRLLLRAVSALSLAQLGRMSEAQRHVGSLDDFVHAPVKAARLSVLPWIEPPALASDLARAELALAQLERALAGGELDQARRWCEAADPVRASSWKYLRARRAVLEAELAIRIVDAARAELALAEAEALCAQAGYRREHATAALIAVALARLAADRAQELAWARLAADRAAGIAPDLEAVAGKLLAGVAGAARSDEPWVVRLDLAAPRGFRLREPGGVRRLTQRQADAVRFADGALGVDAIRRTVQIGGGAPRSFARRDGLWSMLTALLTEPGRVMSPDDLARRAWDVAYHAVRHRSRLVVTISRLRDVLGGDAITSVGGGYRLATPIWAVLESTGDPPPSSPAPPAHADDARRRPRISHARD
jgi:hypothetical protein